MLDMIDAYTAERHRPELSADESPDDTGTMLIEVNADDIVPAPSHWVYASEVHQTTKVHKASR